MSKEKLIYLPVGVLTAATMVSGAMLGGAGSHAATDEATASVTVADACSLTSSKVYDGALSITSGNETSTEGTDKPMMIATCNDPEGFAVFAVGASDEVEVGEVKYTNYMVSTSGNIPAGNTGDSWWAMKVTSSSAGGIQSPFEGYTAVPNENTAIVKVAGSTTGAATSQIRTDYKVHIASGQPAGTYTGRVKYTLVHPSSAQPTE